jgi:hypothetical protein
MKMSSEQETEALMRQFAERQRGDSERISVEISGASTHLDADELNSFAEGAVPPTTRMRFVSHLADCESCRRLATELAVFANVSKSGVGTEASQSKAGSRSLSELLSSLFALPFVRFAVPSLALVAVIAVLFTMTRETKPSVSEPVVSSSQKTDQSASGLVSEHKSSNAPFPETQPARPATGSSGSDLDDRPEGKPKPSVADSPLKDAQAETRRQPSLDELKPREDAGPAKETEKKEIAKRSDTTETARNQPLPAVGGVGVVDSTKGRLDQPRSAGVDTVPAPATPPKAKSEEKREGVSVTSGGAVPARDESRQSTLSASRAARKAPERARDSESGAAGAASTEAAETRSVAGRNFRREGNAWIDSAYRSSMTTVNVSRGSEQFRSLAGDEPVIKAVADAFTGEVVVLIKGKAYRIR